MTPGLGETRSPACFPGTVGGKLSRGFSRRTSEIEERSSFMKIAFDLRRIARTLVNLPVDRACRTRCPAQGAN
jgi:hypothetical protein